MNKVFLVGRLAAEPELRTTPNGVSVCAMTIAVTRRADREKADFIRVIAWRGLGENCAKYLVKGQQAAIAGELRTGSYTAKDGGKRYTMEVYADDVEFLAKPAGGSNNAHTGEDGIDLPDGAEYAYDDGELPF